MSSSQDDDDDDEVEGGDDERRLPAPEGWQIGSGPSEARCKTRTSRLKRSSQRRLCRHAEAIATLIDLRDSDQWSKNLPTATTSTSTKL